MPQPDNTTQVIVICNDVNRANALAQEMGLTVLDGYRFVWARGVDHPIVFKRVPAHEMAYANPPAPRRTGW